MCCVGPALQPAVLHELGDWPAHKPLGELSCRLKHVGPHWLRPGACGVLLSGRKRRSGAGARGH